VILFGSYAYGHPQPESDVDLLVIMRTSFKPTEQAVRICQAIQYHFGLDLIVRTPEMLERRLGWVIHFWPRLCTKARSSMNDLTAEWVQNRIA
jgi:predicted nucleotidyltransferase